MLEYSDKSCEFVLIARSIEFEDKFEYCVLVWRVSDRKVDTWFVFEQERLRWRPCGEFIGKERGFIAAKNAGSPRRRTQASVAQ